VPLDWAAPAGDQIEVLVSRNDVAGSSMQIWLLPGGPGQSGRVFTAAIPKLRSELPLADFLTFDPRGVGESAALRCAAMQADSEAGRAITESEWKGCSISLKRDYGSRLEHFDTPNTARDLAHLIEAERAPEKQVFVFGGSYGTLLALELLRQGTARLDGVILDSVLPPSRRFLSDYDRSFERVGRELGERCARDAECSRHLGPEPWATASRWVRDVGDGHCAALRVDANGLRAALALLVQTVETRTVLFPVLARIARCAPEDLRVLEHLWGYLTRELGGATPGFSQLLQTHVVLSELWDPAIAEGAQAERERAVLWPGYVNVLAPLFAAWPRAAVEPGFGDWPDTTVPVLALHGTLDPQIPLQAAHAFPEEFGGSGTFVEFADAPHGVLDGTPVRTPGQPSCGLTVVASFLRSPRGAPDLGCLSDMRQLTVSPPRELAETLLGTPTAWPD
jgi:pimeloyl-ACP methyl ester carboxylesterase